MVNLDEVMLGVHSNKEAEKEFKMNFEDMFTNFVEDKITHVPMASLTVHGTAHHNNNNAYKVVNQCNRELQGHNQECLPENDP